MWCFLWWPTVLSLGVCFVLFIIACRVFRESDAFYLRSQVKPYVLRSVDILEQYFSM